MCLKCVKLIFTENLESDPLEGLRVAQRRSQHPEPMERPLGWEYGRKARKAEAKDKCL